MFVAVVTLKSSTKSAAAETLGVSWTHLLGVLDGTRVGSALLLAKIADYVGLPVARLFPRNGKAPKAQSNGSDKQ